MTMDLTPQQQRVLKVLERISDVVRDDDNAAGEWTYELGELLDNMLSFDSFGSEGQLDPRGDQRNGPWTMEFVEGVDD